MVLSDPVRGRYDRQLDRRKETQMIHEEYSLALKNQPHLVVLPCPFCGGRNIVVDEIDTVLGNYHVAHYKIVCNAIDEESGCGASSGAFKKPSDALIAWNRRR